MKKNLKTNLKIQRKNHSQKALEKILIGDEKQAERNIQSVKLIDEILNMNNSNTRLYVSILIAFFCLLIVILGSTIRFKHQYVRFSAQCTDLTIDSVDREVTLGSFYTSRLTMDQFSGISIPALGLNHSDDANVQFDLTGDSIRINDITLSAGGTLDISSILNELTFNIKKANVRTSILIKKGKGKVILHDTLYSLDFNISKIRPPEKILVSTKSTDLYPINIHFQNGSKCNLPLSNPRKILFSKYDPSNNQRISTINKAEIHFVETEQVVNVIHSEYFNFRIIQIDNLDVHATPEDIRVDFTGKISDPKVGVKGFEKSVSPTAIEYLYYNHKSGMISASIIFLWGFLWGIKNMIHKPS